MTTSEILDKLEDIGVLYTNPNTTDMEWICINALEAQGVIATATSEGVIMMNSDWAYIRKGNPDNIRVKTEGNYVYLCKM